MSNYDSKTIGGTMEETKERHVKYLRAMNSPVRREILRALKKGPATIEVLKEKTHMEEKVLAWHLSILKYGYCIEKIAEGNVVLYRLTQEGQVVDYVDK
jgi:DNA-binding transcriptional ArsR family regulator